MTLEDLISLLEDLREVHGDVPVRLATQPNWPLSFNVHGVVHHDGRVWIASSYGHPNNENPYAPKEAWDETW